MKREVYIQNLKCGGCANTITKGVSSIEGTSNVVVDEENSRVTFDFYEDDISDVLLKLDQMGYPPADDENSLYKQAKSYVSCMIGRMTKED